MPTPISNHHRFQIASAANDLFVTTSKDHFDFWNDSFVRIAVIYYCNHTDLPLERCAPGIDASRLLVEETGTPAASSEPHAALE